MNKVIETSELTKTYGKTRGIADLNLSVNEGEVFGYIGPNGAGKSTTIRTLLGLIKPTSGSAQVLSMDCVKQKYDILPNIGYIPGEAVFYSDMRVRDCISFSASIRKMNCMNEAAMLCERFNLDPSRKISELSLGNRKKVSIVCAMQHKPCLYVFDEPTSGLDPLMQSVFFELIEERHKEGATVFLSSHVLSEIQRHCTRAAIIRDGSVIANGTIEELAGAAAKRVKLRGISELPRLERVSSVEKHGDAISFLYGGEISALISALNGLSIIDMTVMEPDLDEVFMHFYSNEGDKHED